MSERNDVVDNLNRIAPDTLDEGARGPWHFLSAQSEDGGVRIHFENSEGSGSQLFSVAPKATVEQILDHVMTWSIIDEGGVPDANVESIRNAKSGQADALANLSMDIIEGGQPAPAGFQGLLLELLNTPSLDIIGEVYAALANLYPRLFFVAARRRQGSLLGQNELLHLGNAVLSSGEDPDGPEINPKLRSVVLPEDLIVLREIADTEKSGQGRYNVLHAIALLSDDPAAVLQGYAESPDEQLAEQSRGLLDELSSAAG